MNINSQCHFLQMRFLFINMISAVKYTFNNVQLLICYHLHDYKKLISQCQCRSWFSTFITYGIYFFPWFFYLTNMILPLKTSFKLMVMIIIGKSWFRPLNAPFLSCLCWFSVMSIVCKKSISLCQCMTMHLNMHSEVFLHDFLCVHHDYTNKNLFL